MNTGIVACTKPYAAAHANAKTNESVCAKAYAKAKTDADVCATAYTMAKAKVHALANSRDKAIAEAEATGKTLNKALVKAEVEVITEAQAQAIIEARAEVIATAEAEVIAKTEAEAKALIYSEAKAEAGVKAKAYADADAKAKAEVEVLTPLYNLATDCLRLSMHFFHPIQQCAQQVYHTAIPLSPTSSWLHKSCLPNVTENQLSYVTAFTGAPSTWGSLLRTIDIRPKQLTCIATSVKGIITACEDLVNVYDAVTFVLQQSLPIPEKVTKIQGSPDGSILFFAHSFSVTMWDMQTGGHIDTFTIKSKISDIAISTTGDQIACGSSDGSVTFWNTHTKEKGTGFWNSQPVVAICWMSPWELAVATQSAFYIRNTLDGRTLDREIPGHVWGMVYLRDEDEFLVGTSRQRSGMDQESYFVTIQYKEQHDSESAEPKLSYTRQSPIHNGQLSSPTLMGKDILCITGPENGVRLFSTSSHNWTNTPPLLGAATSVAVSLNRNLVVQTEDFIQIFSVDVLAAGRAHNNVHSAHIYPLGEKHIVCFLQPTRRLTLLELDTLQEIRPRRGASSLVSSLANQPTATHAPYGGGLVAEFGVSTVLEAWRSGTPLPEWAEAADKDAPSSRLSPNGTQVVKVYGSPPHELRVKDAKDGTTLAKLSLEISNLGIGTVYDLVFDSETRFFIKVSGPGWHVQIPYDMITRPSGRYPHTIVEGKPVHLSEPPEPRPTLPYSLDTNCEWVTDAESRKICWISPGNIRRGNGGHFWAGLSLVMVGDDGVVRKLTFKEPVRGREGGSREEGNQEEGSQEGGSRDRDQRRERPRRRARKRDVE